LKDYNISFVGSGKVASALARCLFDKGHKICSIISRNATTGMELARFCDSEWSDKYEVDDKTNILIVSVPDDAISDVLARIKSKKEILIAHTAGSIGLDVFPKHLNKTGVVYPLQTFSTGRNIDLSAVPFFIEGSDAGCTDKLKHLAEELSSSVYVTDADHRRLLHLAAVFVSNFTNHLLTIGKDITNLSGIPFEALQPLILETIDKAIGLGPQNSQTGPAVRYDLNTIEKHLDLLSYSPELKNIYDLMTRSIMSYYKKK
jgi:predicted short-subunit dehydrogenase-like oxidoreductase (DUF2520 family)